jgi:hypothetical protein
MGKFKLLREEISEQKPDDIAKAFQSRIDRYDFDGITVDDVEINMDGSIEITFVDAEGDEMSVLFDYSDEDGVTATILDGEDDDEFIVIDLDPLTPPVVDMGINGIKYPKLDDLTWMNKSAMASLFVAGDLGSDGDPDLDGHLSQIDIEKRQMPKGWMYFKAVEGYAFTEEDESEIEERMVTVVRGGKKVRIPVVRKVRRKKLTPKQKQAIKKAVRKRKMKAGQIARKRKKSLALRKRSGLKKNKFTKYQKAQGTADRKR